MAGKAAARGSQNREAVDQDSQDGEAGDQNSQDWELAGENSENGQDIHDMLRQIMEGIREIQLSQERVEINQDTSRQLSQLQQTLSEMHTQAGNRGRQSASVAASSTPLQQPAPQILYVAPKTGMKFHQSRCCPGLRGAHAVRALEQCQVCSCQAEQER